MLALTEFLFTKIHLLCVNILKYSKPVGCSSERVRARIVSLPVWIWEWNLHHRWCWRCVCVCRSFYYYYYSFALLYIILHIFSVGWLYRCRSIYSLFCLSSVFSIMACALYVFFILFSMSFGWGWCWCCYSSFLNSFMVHWIIEHGGSFQYTNTDNQRYRWWKRDRCVGCSLPLGRMLKQTTPRVESVDCAKICYPWKRKFIDFLFSL